LAKRRTVLNLPGRNRTAPIPDGVRMGNMVFSSALTGIDPTTNEISADPVEQAAQLFKNLRSFMQEAGGSIDDIAHLTLYLKEGQSREPFDNEWNKMFPDADDRPARHRVSAAMRDLFQVELIAVLP
jgi:2-iminobutanoate/2-iminopropanoate deaminase